MRKRQSPGSITPQLRIEYRPVVHLHPDPRNTRQHSAKQVQQIARSIEAFGFNVPVLIDGQNRVVAGHGRVFAAKLLGMSEVPTVALKHLSEAQRRAFMIADNRLTDNFTWDSKLLGEELKFLSEAELDFSVDVTGFEMADVDLYIDGLEAESEPDRADELPTLSETPVSKAGDLWQLGKHRVLCGDALHPASYERLLAKERAGMVFTDPPYNVRIDGHASGNGKTRHRDFPMASGEMTAAEFEAFLGKALGLAADHSTPCSLHFVCMDWRHMAELHAAGRLTYTELKNVCVWAKTSAGMGSFYRSQHELVFVFKSGKSAHRHNIQLGRFGRNRSNLWTYPGANTLRKAGSDANLLQFHPTSKPVALVADALLDASARGELVLDPFLGSGTTVIAAERTGRVCYGLELDALYVDVIVRAGRSSPAGRLSMPTLARPSGRWRG